ncbi:MAG: hypothetical protein U0790_27040 [Isosphaeraceae bacterium]
MASRTLRSIKGATLDHVVAPDGFTSLREAIALADDDGAEDTIVLPHAIGGVVGTYTLVLGELAVDDADALTIESDGGTATIDALGASRVFSIAAGSDVTLRGLVITGGYSAATGGGIYNLGTLTVEGSSIIGNSAAGEGGGLDNLGDGVATISGTTFKENHSGGYGGGFRNLGIWGNHGSMTVSDSAFIGNTSYYNGGGFDNNGVLVLSGSHFEGNQATSGAGAPSATAAR